LFRFPAAVKRSLDPEDTEDSAAKHGKGFAFAQASTNYNITINVPLFKKLRDIIFFCGTRARDNLGVKKVEAPSKCPEKWLIKLLSHKKKLGPKVS
jgi:hypothetical protein